jgi:hypothetical protein
MPFWRFIQAMTIPSEKVLGATALAYALALCGMQTLGQTAGLGRGQEPAKTVPGAEDRQAAPTSSADAIAQAVKRFADVLKRHPAQRRAAREHRLQLYMMDLIEGDTTLLADEPDPGLDYGPDPKKGRRSMRSR